MTTTTAMPEPGLPAPDNAGVRFPPPLLYAAGFAIGAAMQRVKPLPGLPRGVATAVGAMAAAAGGALAGSGVATFRRAGTSLVPIKPSTTIVTSGPYRFTRNPMYVGLGLVYAGAAIWSRVTWALAILPGVLLVVDRTVIAREEGYLERAHTEEYARYRARVRRWL